MKPELNKIVQQQGRWQLGPFCARIVLLAIPLDMGTLGQHVDSAPQQPWAHTALTSSPAFLLLLKVLAVNKRLSGELSHPNSMAGEVPCSAKLPLHSKTRARMGCSHCSELTWIRI